MPRFSPTARRTVKLTLQLLATDAVSIDLKGTFAYQKVANNPFNSMGIYY